MKYKIKLQVNGQGHEVLVKAKTLLVELLRDELGLTGTNKGCGAGECGACTVIMNGNAVNSCQVLAADADGTEITTIEGLASNGKLHPLQKAFIEEGAVQCGYCTPGLLMSSASLLAEKAHPSEEQARQALTGNLCRCTGYYSVLRAVERAAEKAKTA